MNLIGQPFYINSLHFFTSPTFHISLSLSLSCLSISLYQVMLSFMSLGVGNSSQVKNKVMLSFMSLGVGNSR
ncbi:hypothetical protein P8452_24710 [Trifolium repens]|nr:hypothetical protein P8452_24710 [Trifolium repens]